EQGQDGVVAVQQHAVVEVRVDPGADDAFDAREVHDHPQRVELAGFQRDDGAAVVAVQVAALAVVVEQAMAVTKTEFTRHAIHGPLTLSGGAIHGNRQGRGPQCVSMCLCGPSRAASTSRNETHTHTALPLPVRPNLANPAMASKAVTAARYRPGRPPESRRDWCGLRVRHRGERRRGNYSLRFPRSRRAGPGWLRQVVREDFP